MKWSRVVGERMRERTKLSNSHGGDLVGTINVPDMVGYSESSIRPEWPQHQRNYRGIL